MRHKTHIKKTETIETLKWLAANGPADADELAGHILVDSTRSASLMAQHLKKLKKAGLLRFLKPIKEPMEQKIELRALPPAKIIPFPVAFTQIKEAA